MKYETLFTPLNIGSLMIKNRGVMSPMATDLADTNGNATRRSIAYYEERAKGGIGLIITEYTGVDHIDSIPSIHNFRMAEDRNIKPAEELTNAVHAYGAKIFAQLHHAGATSKSANTGRQNLSPSGVPMVPGGEMPVAMTLEDIERVQRKFVNAAVRCKKAGFDGVELHGAHSYLIAQFFSKYYNQRTDMYGGSVENRCRFVVDIIKAIRKKLGNYPLTVRISGDEMTKQEGFLTLEDGLEIGKYLAGQGIDALNVSNGSAWNANANCDPYSHVPGWKRDVAKAFKDALDIPIIATNTIKTPDFAESLLKDGVSDFVGLGRSQFADPEFMNKAKKEQADKINRCIGCMYCRERLQIQGLPVQCSVNPRLGREYAYNWKDLQKDGQDQTVVVIGGGPAGMEAAIILKKRGFAVTLLEQSDSLGGTMKIAKIPPYKGNLPMMYQTMENELRSLGVNILLNTKATVEAVEKISPVGVFIAVGSFPIIPYSIPGIEEAVLAEDVISGNATSGKTAVLIGSGLTGLECADVILGKGIELTIVEQNPVLGQGIFPVLFNDTYGRIKPHAPTELTSYRLEQVLDHGVELVHIKTKETKVVEADTVILSLGTRPQPEVVEEFEKAGFNTIAVGSAEIPGRIVGAVQSAFYKAWVFQP
ncbi:MAG: FAD-dependent oxidoreductase [Bacillota bacterium]